MKAYLLQDPLYRDRFSGVWLWSEWTGMRPDFAGGDTGINLVTAERGGGYCAIRRLRLSEDAGLGDGTRQVLTTGYGCPMHAEPITPSFCDEGHDTAGWLKPI